MNSPDPARLDLVLASGSAIRRELLVNVGLTVETRPAEIDERALEEGLLGASPEMLAIALAEAKAQWVSQKVPGALVLGCDQVLDHDGEVLHKAPDRAAASAKLARLSGSTHTLISAAALVRDGKTLWSGSDMAQLTMRSLSARDIDAYLDRAGDAATASVGAYRLEEHGAALFERFEGNHFTILGLPLLMVLHALRDLGVDPATGSTVR
ncbi:MAG: septum formation protein Maf [Devosiaceae bacterium]|nr:septum formation protein Maf [Devosiaceae bacterium MH13]